MDSNAGVDLRADYARKLGDVVSVMLQSSYHRSMRVGSIAVWIDPGILLEQLLLLRDSLQRPYAYCCWASVTDEVLNRLRDNPDLILHISEWNEGENIWIIDFAFRKGMLRQAVRELTQKMGSDWSAVNFLHGEYHRRASRS